MINIIPASKLALLLWTDNSIKLKDEFAYKSWKFRKLSFIYTGLELKFNTRMIW